MKPERIPLDRIITPGNEHLMHDIASEIARGAVFVYPTETIYGIGGSTLVASVHGAIYEAKKRPASNPMIHLAGKSSVFSEMLDNAPNAEQFLAEKFWPGLLTIVISSESNPDGTAIRVSAHPFISALYTYADFPIYSTSANVSGEQYNPDPDYIYSSLRHGIDFMIDAGHLPPSLPSTVIKFTDSCNVNVLREGVLTKKTIADALQRGGYSVTVE
jgi:L-threonylcarbamoyladenylate synthase